MMVCFASGIYFSKYTPASKKMTESTKVSKKKGIQPFSVKLPDGLYLYQPYTIIEQGLSFIGKNHVRPLFHIVKGKMFDTSSSHEKMNLSRLDYIDKYIANKQFNVFLSGYHVGELKFDEEAYNSCRNDSYSYPVGIEIEAPLKNKYHRSKTKGNIRYYQPNVLLVPVSYKVNGKIANYKLSQKDRDYYVKRLHNDLFPSLIKRKVITKTNAEKSKQKVLYAAIFDYDGNNKRDLLGIYYIRPSSTKSKGFYLLFFIRDNGDIEFIEKTTRRFSTVIDINQDGYMEIVMVEDKDSDIPASYVRRTSVLYRSVDGEWQTKYESRWTFCR